ncbi:MAG: efflux RND transporter periplasmic adaptor subunit [Candidatus Omnitrophica bacterium]|nr:efflux RND transporter periplasmic adaptor subunit [Candidatus Omnitrophota bacterium]
MKKLFSGLGTLLKWTVGVVFLLVIVAYLAGVFEQKIEPGQIEQGSVEEDACDQVAEPMLVNEPQIEQIPGTIAAKHETTISSRILATIEQVLVRAGDVVKSGSPLVILDSRELETRELQAEEALAASQAQLKEAETEFARSQNLFDQGTIPKSRYDTAESGYRVAQANVERAKQNLEEVRVSQTYARIESPISGRVIDRLAEPGDTASPGVPLLRLYDPSDLRLEAYVRESLASQINRGEKIQVRVETLNKTFEGKVEEIVPQADPGSRSLLVKIALPETEGLYPGMFGRVLIQTGTEERLYVPSDAVRAVGQLRYVQLIGEGGREKRLLKLGQNGPDGKVSVLSGIDPSESVKICVK